MNFTKEDIAKELNKNFGFSDLYSKKIINDLLFSFIEIICKSDLNLKNFGVFKISIKKERIGRNPKTSEEFTISKRKSVRFIPSRNFSIYLNEN